MSLCEKMYTSVVSIICCFPLRFFFFLRESGSCGCCAGCLRAVHSGTENSLRLNTWTVRGEGRKSVSNPLSVSLIWETASMNRQTLRQTARQPLVTATNCALFFFFLKASPSFFLFSSLLSVARAELSAPGCPISAKAWSGEEGCGGAAWRNWRTCSWIKSSVPRLCFSFVLHASSVATPLSVVHRCSETTLGSF